MSYERTPEIRQRLSDLRKKLWANPESNYRHSRAHQVGEQAPGWKGGQTVKRGYVYLYAPDHPRRESDRSPYVKRSRLVVEKRLGRYLESGEHVHHVNGIRDDDRDENLVVLTKAAHRREHGPPPQPWPDQLARGERVGASKLTEAKVRDIRTRLAAGESQRSIARMYGVTPPVIRGVQQGTTWAHVR
jgi:hypothetical protein